MSSSTAIGDDTQAVPAVPEPTWYDDSVERYSNPAAYARKNAPQPALTPVLQEEISLAVPGGQAAKLEVRKSSFKPTLRYDRSREMRDIGDSSVLEKSASRLHGGVITCAVACVVKQIAPAGFGHALNMQRPGLASEFRRDHDGLSFPPRFKPILTRFHRFCFEKSTRPSRAIP